MRIRAKRVAVAITAAGWAITVGVAPTAWAEPSDANCTEMSSGSCVYKNCSDAKAHGRCNITRDDPAYCPSQDRDNDGLACEC
ncbi:MAG: excalibur calcium-binding domain-containing protein [Mycobacterium sp.]